MARVALWIVLGETKELKIVVSVDLKRGECGMSRGFGIADAVNSLLSTKLTA